MGNERYLEYKFDKISIERKAVNPISFSSSVRDLCGNAAAFLVSQALMLCCRCATITNLRGRHFKALQANLITACGGLRVFKGGNLLPIDTIPDVVQNVTANIVLKSLLLKDFPGVRGTRNFVSLLLGHVESLFNGEE